MEKTISTNFLEGLNEPILSLTSTEFSSLVNISKPVYEVSFVDCKGEKCKAISVFNKQNRGSLLRYIITTNINQISDLPEQFNGYTKESINSKNNI